MSISPDSSQSPEPKSLGDLQARLIQTIANEFLHPLEIVHQSTDLLACFGNTWEVTTCLQHLHRIQEAVEQMNSHLEKCLQTDKDKERK